MPRDSATGPGFAAPASADSPAVVMLPCRPDQFKEFIGNLLGEPQVITKTIPGEFELNKENIVDLYHLVMQRVGQQNDAALLQFTARILFDDNSSTLINSIEDLEHYNEVRPISSVAVHLTWTFLAQFRDKDVPEKQTIEVSFVTRDLQGRIAVFADGLAVPRRILRFANDFISFRIAHTARTWGADIEALLTGHIQVLLKTENPYKNFARKHGGWIALAIFALLFLSSVAGSFFTLHSFMDAQTRKIRLLNASPAAKAGAVSEKVDYLMNLIASGVWPRYFFYIFVFLITSFIISAILAFWAGTAAEIDDPSFVLLTRQSEKRKVDLLKKNKKEWLTFSASIVTSVIVGVAKQFVLSGILKMWPPSG